MMKKTSKAVMGVALAALVLGATGQARAELVYGYGINNGANLIFSFDSATPQTVISSALITGLSANDTLQGIDIRPATGALYGFGNSNNLYTINPLTGMATLQSNVGPAADGAQGIDFNPVPDRLRIVTSVDQNLRANVDTGATITDTSLAYAMGDPNFGTNPNIVGAGYTNSRAGATSTTLYDIDSNLNTLAIQTNPNAGTLKTVGALGVDISDVAELDISGQTNVAYLSNANPTSNISSFYTVNLGTGAASFVGNFNPIVGQVNGIAVAAPVPEPGTMALMGLGVASLAAARRRKKASEKDAPLEI